MISEVVCLVIGYIFGMFLTAEIVVRIRKGKNIREIGSGNPGMANVMKNVGKTEGFLVLAGDILKTAVAVLIAWLIFKGEMTFHEIALWTAFGTIIGHDFPAIRGFRGGKGVTSTCSWLVLSMPIFGSLACIAGGIITVITKKLHLGAVLIPLFALPFAFIFGDLTEKIMVLIAAVIMIIKNTGRK